ncbi:MAG: hypothetical protein HQK77_06370 [Desulfobacterales bacterium]|nr:hypothetical protein [Desulfobacterales bacterium]
MKSVVGRLYQIAKAYITDTLNPLSHTGQQTQQDNFYGQYQEPSNTYSSNTHQRQQKHHSHALPKQVIEDLSVFGLKPPSSWEDVRSARNREIKKYHSDRFINDPKKFETSKEMMQIYNAAYERLKLYFHNHP